MHIPHFETKNEGAYQIAFSISEHVCCVPESKYIIIFFFGFTACVKLVIMVLKVAITAFIPLESSENC